MKSIVLLILFIGLFSCSDKNIQIEIIPGIGIIINHDSVNIGRYSPNDLMKKFNIKDTFELNHIDCESYDSDGNAIIGEYYFKSIIFKEIEFTFQGRTKEKLILRNIYIKTSPLISSVILSKNVLTDTSTYVMKSYPKAIRYNMPADLSYAESSDDGITFLMDTLNNKLKKIGIHQKNN